MLSQVSYERIHEFLIAEEVTQQLPTIVSSKFSSSSISVQFQNARIGWSKAIKEQADHATKKSRSCCHKERVIKSKGKIENILEGISFQVQASELTVVTGPVASGKSSLVRAIATHEPLVTSGSPKTHPLTLVIGKDYNRTVACVDGRSDFTNWYENLIKVNLKNKLTLPVILKKDKKSSSASGVHCSGSVASECFGQGEHFIWVAL